MTTAFPLYQVDAFTNVPFRGNPAAVCLLEGPRDAAWMQAVAAEMNLAETAFVWDEANALRLRWFTPAVEVPLCGHATLASAHALWETGRAKADAAIAFQTLSGRLTAERESGGWIRLDFPALPPRAEPCAAPAGLTAALGLTGTAGSGDAGDAIARVYEVPRPNASDGPSWLVELASVAALRALAPDFRALRDVDGHAVIATARAEGEHDFASRFFAPKAGVDEDPVTGSAHCSLAPFWCARLGRSELSGVQLSQRTGVVRVRTLGARVHLLGRALTVLRGELDA
jgi:PhzF family phenazine biosynthesis protein